MSIAKLLFRGAYYINLVAEIVGDLRKFLDEVGPLVKSPEMAKWSKVLDDVEAKLNKLRL